MPPIEDAGGMFPTPPVTDDLAALAVRLEAQRRIVDARLDRPPRWRGQLRREVHGYAQPPDVARYARAYDKFVTSAAARSWTMDAHALGEIHDAAVGGAAFRTVELTVGGNHRLRSPSEVPELVDKALAQAASSAEPLPVVASRLHLSLLTIHPFLDGNGRTARLAATLWLVRGGFRSTLFTAVEQHFHPTPARYLEVLDRFRYCEITEDSCVAALVRAMVANAMYAAWFRARALRLRARCAALGISSTATLQAVEAYDLNRDPGSSGDAARLSDAVAGQEIPLHLLNETLTSDQRTELVFQVDRMLTEEAEAGE